MEGDYLADMSLSRLEIFIQYRKIAKIDGFCIDRMKMQDYFIQIIIILQRRKNIYMY